MGASQSVKSVDEFKDYLYGTAVLMVSPRLDGELKYKECDKITDEDKHVLPMVLEKQQPKDIDEVVKAYREYYGNSGKEDAIDKYVTEHILDSEEHIDDFMKQLVSLLQERRNHVENGIKRIASSAPAPVPAHVPSNVKVQSAAPSMRQQVGNQLQSPAPTLIPTQTPTPTPAQAQGQTSHRIRGHGKLQRRIQSVNQAIGNEQAIYDSRQASVKPPNPTPASNPASVASTVHQPPDKEAMKNLETLVTEEDHADVDVYDEASTADEETQAHLTE